MKSNGRTVHCQSKIRGTFLMHIQTIMLFHIALFTWLWASSAVFFSGLFLALHLLPRTFLLDHHVVLLDIVVDVLPADCGYDVIIDH